MTKLERNRALISVLPLLVVDIDEDCSAGHKRIVMISTKHLAAAPWSESRLEECRALLQEGRAAPAIDVTRFKLRTGSETYWKLARKGETHWYVPNDGMHRGWAYTEAGRERIAACVSGECIIRPERFLITRCVEGERDIPNDPRYGAHLYLNGDPEPGWMKHVTLNPLSEHAIEVCRELGVRVVEYTRA